MTALGDDCGPAPVGMLHQRSHSGDNGGTRDNKVVPMSSLRTHSSRQSWFLSPPRVCHPGADGTSGNVLGHVERRGLCAAVSPKARAPSSPPDE